MSKIFITREQGPESPLRRRLEAAGHLVEGRSLVEFGPVGGWTLPDLGPSDWIFFYSPRGARYFAEGLGGKQLPRGVRLAAIGAGTAGAVEEALRRWPDFVGNGDPSETARAFGVIAWGRTVVFPGARRSERSVRRLLGDSVQGIDLTVYDNQPIAGTFPCPKADVLVFTSPMNARTYYDRCAPRGETVLAIGQTTAAALRELGRTEVLVSEEADEGSLAELCLRAL